MHGRGMHGGGHVWQGACMAEEGVHGRGHALQRVCGGGSA